MMHEMAQRIARLEKLVERLIHRHEQPSGNPSLPGAVQPSYPITYLPDLQAQLMCDMNPKR